MREIKFRAWDGKRMYVFKGPLGMLDDGGIYQHDPEHNPKWWDSNPYVDTYVIKESIEWEWMQYTGLKDKNGVEIYEGDIGYLVNENNKGVVKYSEEWAAFYFAGDNGSWWCDFCSDQGCSGDSLEVIGNIYENKELLE